MNELRVHFRRWVRDLPEGRAKYFYQWLSFRLVLAFGLFTVAIVTFAKLANDIREQDTLGIDRGVLVQLHNLLGSKVLDIVVPATTDIGGTVGITAITIVAVATCLRWHRFNRALFLAVAISGAVVLNLVLKSLFWRSRPELWQQLVIENGFSFPSGHAMASSALALAVVIALWNTRWRVAAVIAGAFYAVYVGFTRLYLGVHYPTDIIGAWMISFAWVALVYMVFSSVKIRPHRTTH